MHRLATNLALPLVAVMLATLAGLAEADAKMPGTTHCYNRICHRVLTLSETAGRIGQSETVTASFYGAPGEDAYNPRAETSSGAIFDPDRDDTVASPVYPDGTRLVLWNRANGHAASVRVTNAGPYMGSRTIDASTQLARRLGFHHLGVARLDVVVLAAPTKGEATYRKGRIYPPVPGYIGRFDSLDLAVLADADGAAAVVARSLGGGELPIPRLASASPATAVAGFQATALQRRQVQRVRIAARLPRAVTRPEPASRPIDSSPGHRCVFDRDPACS